MLKTATILVADNDEEALRRQEEALREEGFRVLTACNSSDVKRELQHEQIDVAILDVRLNDDDDESDTSGLDLAEVESPSVSKVITTVWPNPEVRRRVQRLEAESKTVYFVDDKATMPILKAVWRALALRLAGAEVVAHNPVSVDAAPAQLVFISYSREDKLYKDELCKYLKTLVVHGQLRLWTDEHIETGADWRDMIERAINEAAIAVQLITTNYLNSDFINGRIAVAVRAARAGALSCIRRLRKSAYGNAWLAERIAVRTDKVTPSFHRQRQAKKSPLTIAEDVADFVTSPEKSGDVTTARAWLTAYCASIGLIPYSC